MYMISRRDAESAEEPLLTQWSLPPPRFNSLYTPTGSPLSGESNPRYRRTETPNGGELFHIYALRRDCKCSQRTQRLCVE